MALDVQTALDECLYSVVLQIRLGKGDNFPYYSFQKYSVAHPEKRLIQTVLMRGHNICFD